MNTTRCELCLKPTTSLISHEGVSVCSGGRCHSKEATKEITSGDFTEDQLEEIRADIFADQMANEYFTE